MQEQDLQGNSIAPIKVHLNRSKGYKEKVYDFLMVHAMSKVLG